jgi:hypothetical protein
MENSPRDPKIMVMDASYWVIEGLKGGRYKLVQRVPPDIDKDAEFVNLGLTMLELAGFDLRELGLLRRRPVASAKLRLTATEGHKHVPILKIALNCDELDGRRVTIMGAVSISFEQKAICPTEEFLASDLLNCLWLAADDALRAEELEKIGSRLRPGTSTIVSGKVSCTNRGLGGLYGGAIEGITLIVDASEDKVLWTVAAPGSSAKPPP